GQIRPSDDVRRTTALTLEADLAGSRRDVSEVPQAVLSRRSKTVSLLDHLVGAGEQPRPIGHGRLLALFDAIYRERGAFATLVRDRGWSAHTLRAAAGGQDLDPGNMGGDEDCVLNPALE